MLSIIRPFLAAVLCSVIALGHAPAWLHVATCHDGVTCDSGSADGGSAGESKPLCVDLAHADESGSVHAGCSHGCHHHDNEPVTATDAPDDHQHSPAHHDHDRCLICQSLTAPCGFTWELETAVLSDVDVEQAENQRGFILVSAFLVVAAPRGPPAIA
ncbi:DUF2946 domain-containing protein [Novipirellula sp.]|uniref:DUF2946 domain-containing protein n=1 Tax=Novipirellula sp. TaxID=2795430 RepID=UPI00356883B0